MSHQIIDLRRISPEQLAMLGALDLAYVKSVDGEGGRAYAIHAADGTEIAVFTDAEVAKAAARQHDMEPLSVH